MYLGRSEGAHTHVGLYGRNVGRRMVVARSNEMGIERRLNRSRIVVVTTA